MTTEEMEAGERRLHLLELRKAGLEAQGRDQPFYVGSRYFASLDDAALVRDRLIRSTADDIDRLRAALERAGLQRSVQPQVAAGRAA